MTLVIGGQKKYGLNTEYVPCVLNAYLPDVSTLWGGCGNCGKYGLEEVGH